MEIRMNFLFKYFAGLIHPFCNMFLIYIKELKNIAKIALF